uniref:uncharacterized protein LOC120342552 n=1 Tax=Styela clava TaxID=7725 RepID=UPI001939D89A|nr:uncharacterized protein LOC120342552 [Styela clava]
MYVKLLFTACLAICIEKVVLQGFNDGFDDFSDLFDDIPPTVLPTPTKDPECYIGRTFFNGTHITLNNQTSEVCLPHEKTCQTKVEIGPESYKIFRQCKEPEVCKNNQANNNQVCYSEEAKEKEEQLCYFCCQGDFCNDGEEIDVLLPGALPQMDETDGL